MMVANYSLFFDDKLAKGVSRHGQLCSKQRSLLICIICVGINAAPLSTDTPNAAWPKCIYTLSMLHKLFH